MRPGPTRLPKLYRKSSGSEARLSYLGHTETPATALTANLEKSPHTLAYLPTMCWISLLFSLQMYS